MATTIKRCGSSLALPIPGVLAKALRLQDGSLVDVSLVEGTIIIKPVRGRKISLSHMLKGITRNNRHSAQYGDDVVAERITLRARLA